MIKLFEWMAKPVTFKHVIIAIIIYKAFSYTYTKGQIDALQSLIESMSKPHVEVTPNNQ